jgi:hypothetical protein
MDLIVSQGESLARGSRVRGGNALGQLRPPSLVLGTGSTATGDAPPNGIREVRICGW